MAREEATSAIVLHGSDLGESDRLITLYTADFGRLKGVAKGAKRSRRRFLNALEPFTHIHLVFTPARSGGLALLQQASIRRSFPALAERWPSFALASLCCELVSLWTREGDGDIRIFRLLYGLLSALEEAPEPYLPALTFQLQLLYLVGYGLSLERCVVCGGGLTPAGCRISPDGLLCGGCTPPGVRALAPETLLLLRRLARTRIDRLQGVSPPLPALGEAWALLKEIHIHRLQRIPASYNVLKPPKGAR